ncbi:hypothetical protein [Albidovulum sp.]|uniref:hypothetical protein n=1 Tax=Albidovulum sp. TaxID=1872424 RepID=UPI0039B8B6A5
MRDELKIFEGRVATFPPGHGDLFVITLVGDEIVYNEPIMSYDLAVRRAEYVVSQLMWRRAYTVKVLPLSGQEARALGLLPDDLFANLTPDEHHEMRERARETCIRALERNRDPKVRADAYDTLAMIGPRP